MAAAVPSRPLTLVVTGMGQTWGDCDPRPFLRVQKNRKFMGLQDDMAVVAAGRAISQAGAADGAGLGERAGLYLAVGYIPFEARDIQPVLQGSLDSAGHFSMARFAEEGMQRANPLLTFRCLPNMPAFHVSLNFGVQGPYAVLYPGPAQCGLALEEACFALLAGEIDLALVLGVAHQRNFLVEHQMGRHGLPIGDLQDAAGCLVVEETGRALARGARVLARLEECQVGYALDAPPAWDPLGAAALPVGLGRAAPGPFVHEARGLDGTIVRSRWEVEAP